MTHPFDRPDFSALSRPAIEEAVEAQRHLAQFHTRDIVEHRAVATAHRHDIGDADFGQLVHTYLERNALTLGLRGPLPGHPERGERWAWHVDGARDI